MTLVSTLAPLSIVHSAHARTYASVRSQSMQVYVQKSTSTTFPRRLSAMAAAS